MFNRLQTLILLLACLGAFVVMKNPVPYFQNLHLIHTAVNDTGAIVSHMSIQIIGILLFAAVRLGCLNTIGGSGCLYSCVFG